MWRSMVTVGALVAMIGCSDQNAGSSAAAEKPPAEPAPVETSSAPKPPAAAAASDAPTDGELPLPSDYKQWSVFLDGIQKAETKQIRDIYINSAAEAVTPGAELPAGSVLVMEIYGVEQDADGNAVTDADGNMKKASLSKVFVMGKNPGWGGNVAGPPNGEWIYAAYEADGAAATADYNACRACHAPLVNADYVHRLDEYLEKR